MVGYYLGTKCRNLYKGQLCLKKTMLEDLKIVSPKWTFICLQSRKIPKNDLERTGKEISGDLHHLISRVPLVVSTMQHKTKH